MATDADTDRDQADIDLRAAKERLGAWLVAWPCRGWTSVCNAPDGIWTVALWNLFLASPLIDHGPLAEADAKTEAAAILAALEKVNG